MNESNKGIGKEVRAYCAYIGTDPLLVQGAGGNVSWKEGKTLWVKASGAWLAEANDKEIFVPVDLSHLRQAIAAGDFEVSPKVCIESILRPSIETFLHAVMPHKVVVHLHAIEILSHLIRPNSEVEVKRLMGSAVDWVCVDYFKPGADLATAVHSLIQESNKKKIAFLKNHGVLIGGKSIKEVNEILMNLTSIFKISPQRLLHKNHTERLPIKFNGHRYVYSDSAELNYLATNDRLFRRLMEDWALYPDHVVFLGAKAICAENIHDFIEITKNTSQKEGIIFVRNVGVFENTSLSKAKKEQASCYAAVLLRQSNDQELCKLSDKNVDDLINWEHEKYRTNISC